jgi:PAS domain S-box-containing protein
MSDAQGERSFFSKRSRRLKYSQSDQLLFQKLVEMAEEGVLVAHPATRKFLFANAAICRMLQFSAEELCCMAVEDIHPKEAIDRVFAAFYDLTRGRKSLVNSVPVRRKDGSILYADITAKPALIAGREYAAGFFADVTSRVEAEDALRVSEERYRQLFDRMASCVAVYEARADGQDFVLTDLNRAAEQTEAVSKADVVGKSILAALPSTEKSGLFEAIQRVWRTGEPEHHPLVAKYGDERIQGWQDSYVYRLPSGQVVAAYEDVTEREKAKETLRVLAEAEREQRILAEALADVAVSIAAKRTLQDILAEILDQVQKIVPYTSANVALTRDGVIRTALSRGYEVLGGQDVVRALALPVEAFPLTAGVIENKGALVVEDSQTDPRWVAMQDTAWVRSHLAVPIVSHEQVVGILRLDSERPRQFTSEDARRLKPLAGAAAVALENAELYERVQNELTARRQTEEALRHSAQRLHALASRLAEAQETELMRISRELHDRVGQTLTALGMRLDSLSADLREGSGTDRVTLDAARALLDESIRSVRALMADLRPSILDDYGLAAALNSFPGWFHGPSSLAVTVDAPEVKPRLPQEIATALFRITQEALANVVKHAKASNVAIRLKERDGVARLDIEDDGAGFDPEAREVGDLHWGMEIMRERAESVGGCLTVRSSPGRGTHVVVEVPRL